MCEYLAQFLQSKFANMNRVQIETFVLKLFNALGDWTNFKDTLRDLLISMRSFASQNDEFYEEERQVSTGSHHIYFRPLNTIFVLLVSFRLPCSRKSSKN